jgi:hypothetical protein
MTLLLGQVSLFYILVQQYLPHANISTFYETFRRFEHSVEKYHILYGIL